MRLAWDTYLGLPSDLVNMVKEHQRRSKTGQYDEGLLSDALHSDLLRLQRRAAPEGSPQAVDGQQLRKVSRRSSKGWGCRRHTPTRSGTARRGTARHGSGRAQYFDGDPGQAPP